MRPVSIARSLTVALLGLAVVLSVVAALGVAGLYDARQRYEDELARSYELQASAARLFAAGLLEEQALRRRPHARRHAAASFEREARTARSLALADAPSAALVARRVAAQRRARARARRGDDRFARALRTTRGLSSALAARQVARRAAARERTRDDTRRSLITAGAAGLLALIAAMALVAVLISRMRAPLDRLVRATGRVASGDFEERVEPEGPRELQALGEAFNAMAGEIAVARERIEAERRRLAVTVESLGDALIGCDADGTVTLLNPRAAELVPSVAVGDRVGEGGALPPLESALGGEVTVESAGRTLAVTAGHLGGRREGFVWTVRDISERARLERLKSEFVATASHELRSPLTSIKGFVELLTRSKDLGKREREWAEVILVSTNRLVDLVDDLLDVASVEAGKVEISHRPTDLGDICREVAALLRPRIEDKGQRLELQLPRELPRAIADPERMRQILTNLLTNAHQYTDEGGVLTVRAEVEPAAVALQVIDTGRGMSGGQIDQIFERFYRGGDEELPGTGLGLAIVKSLIDLQDGSIEVESEPGTGTTFTVRLPRETEGGGDAAAELVIRGRRLLVVDDEPDVADVIARQLAPYDVETVAATSGEQALELLRRQDFDAVTLDILMAGMSGFEVLREIRADPDLAATPVVVVSVFSGRQALAGEWTVGKPIDSGELVDALGSAVLAGRSRVLVVGRAGMRPEVGPVLEELGLDYEWVTSGAAAARACAAQRFEVALVDAGMRSAQAALESLELRGRRTGRAVVLFSSKGDRPAAVRLQPEPLPIREAAAAVAELLEAGPGV